MEHGFINLTPENIMDEHKGHGYGRQLMEYCLNDAKERGKSGVCMLGAEKQKAWLSDQAFAMKYGFESLRMDGARKVLAGITSVEEVLMVTHEEDIARHAHRIIKLKDGEIESDVENPNPIY